MDYAEQRRHQQYVDQMRGYGKLTAVGRDIAEVMIWKAHKQPDGSFMMSFEQMAGMARCCRDSAIEGVRVMLAIGFLVREKTRAWCELLGRWVQGKNRYRLVMPTLSESEIPIAGTVVSKILSLPSFIPVPAKEDCQKQEAAPPATATEAPPEAAPGENKGSDALASVSRVAPRQPPPRQQIPVRRSPLFAALESLGRAIGIGWEATADVRREATAHVNGLVIVGKPRHGREHTVKREATAPGTPVRKAQSGIAVGKPRLIEHPGSHL